jgi:hypothetical protein
VRLKPLPHPDKIYVTFPWHPEEVVPHYITDPGVLGRIESLVNSEQAGWTDIVEYLGKAPMTRAEMTWYSGSQVLTVNLGSRFLRRGPMLQNIPLAHGQELLGLLGGRASE